MAPFKMIRNNKKMKYLSNFVWGFMIVALSASVSAQTSDSSALIWPTTATMATYQAQSDSSVKTDVYHRPYSLTENQVDKPLLYKNTGFLVGAGVATMGILYALPSSFTNWEDDGKSPGSKWWKNVSREPVWDKDDLFLNYIAHPYVGAVYYMGARSAGVNAAYSFTYSFMLSTFFWEYGIEAFAERPSIQDLIVTPVGGAIVGEGFYLLKRHIVENDDCLFGSRILGKTTSFLMDPMTEITHWLSDKEPVQNKTVSFSSQPILTHKGGIGYGLHMTVAF